MDQNKGLLFVDDEKEILDILVDLFSDEGYQLHVATRAEDALKIMNAHCIDFILSDLKLPDASGTELLQQVRQKKPETVCVLTSGYLDLKFGSVIEDESDGTLYLSKPWDILTLKQLVSEKIG
ncbi:response regulator [bacterium]|nr:response regulator [bacterium]